MDIKNWMLGVIYLLDNYEIVLKQRYMGLLDWDFNNLKILRNEYCKKCGELLEINVEFYIFYRQRKESNLRKILTIMMKKTIHNDINSATGHRNKYEIWAQQI